MYIGINSEFAQLWWISDYNLRIMSKTHAQCTCRVVAHIEYRYCACECFMQASVAECHGELKPHANASGNQSCRSNHFRNQQTNKRTNNKHNQPHDFMMCVHLCERVWAHANDWLHIAKQSSSKSIHHVQNSLIIIFTKARTGDDQPEWHKHS